MRKIAVVIPKYGLVGGAEQFVSQLTGRLHADHACHCSVFANRWEGGHPDIAFTKIPIVSFPKFLTTLSFAWFVRKRVLAGSYDLVHTHDRIFAADLFTLHGIPHRYWIENVRKKRPSLYDAATAWMEKKLVYEGGCRKFVAVSNLTKDIFLRQYSVDPEKVVVIHPGVEPRDYLRSDRKVARAEIRGEYGISENERVLVFASMNFEIKGLDAIIEALGLLKNRGEAFRLIVAGKGNAAKYQRLAQKAGVDDRIIFTGRLAKDDLIRHYLAGDAYIMLSAFDTFGMVVLEAMAAGLPVIVSGNVGARDVVRESENGFVIDNPADTQDIAAKIQWVTDPARRAALSQAALTTARQNSWAVAAEKYSRLYDTILAEKKERAAG
ncbi:MAG: glycosyltransferase family 4 protein [Smithellaceae bacterium]